MSGRKSILVFMGTRPEAIKMAPVVAALRGDPELDLPALVPANLCGLAHTLKCRDNIPI